MAIVQRGRTFSNGDNVTNVDLHNLFDAAGVSYITNSDFAALASIPDSKLANIVSAGKVNLSALALASQAAGDILWSSDGSTFTRIPIGTAGQKLKIAWDSYTKAVSNFDGSDEAVAYTDPIAGAYTFQGTAQLDTAQYKFGSASLLLDGNSDYVTLPDSADWSFGTDDFTIDFWMRLSALPSGDHCIVSQWEDVNNLWKVLINSSNQIEVYFVDDSSAKANYRMSSGISGLAADTWYHVAIERTTTTAKIYINGVSQTLTETTAFGSNNVGDLTGDLTVGALNGTQFFNGYIEELRISKGIARWTSDFTVPAFAYTPTPTWTTP